MNEFVSKKLAEVQAFIDLSSKIAERGGEPFATTAPDVHQLLTSLHGDVGRFVESPDLQKVFQTKRERTSSKVTQMMELYIGESWDNPVEVLEWLSFYAGSASAHSALVSSALTALSQDDAAAELAGISESFWSVLTKVKEELRVLGAQRATT
jgi:hypothetical protein